MPRGWLLDPVWRASNELAWPRSLPPGRGRLIWYQAGNHWLSPSSIKPHQLNDVDFVMALVRATPGCHFRVADSRLCILLLQYTAYAHTHHHNTSHRLPVTRNLGFYGTELSSIQLDKHSRSDCSTALCKKYISRIWWSIFVGMKLRNCKKY
jgi:hypothetical protein